MTKPIFVFGSNEAGIHGAGAALVAYKSHGARFGKCYGQYGDSFAIPTKDALIASTLPIARIKQYVEGFLAYAAGQKESTFKVTRIGCGLAGMIDTEIAPMFWSASSNCLFDSVWKPHMLTSQKFWGTF